ncbi:MAG: M15 family metallopeptidase [Pyrinomonadaceae bacterium]|nr:M15 family metallopeptidase [Pyrinomonadaceae bacterium]
MLRRTSLWSLAILLLLSSSPASAQQIPQEPGPFRNPELVELTKVDPTIKLDIRYATKSNFLGSRVYRQARAFLQRPAAEALVRVNQSLRQQGFGLIVFDGYRPWSVTKVFWDATPEDRKVFVADPSKGSRHNRGCAVDLSMFELKTGAPVQMPSEYDEFTERAHINYECAPSEAKRLRGILRAAMEGEGFTVYEPEWWHYDFKDWKEYPIMNVKFSEIHKP